MNKRAFRSAASFGLGDGYGLDTDGSIVLLRDQPGGDVAGTRYRMHDFYTNGVPMLIHTVVPGPHAVTFRHSVPDTRPLLMAVTAILAAPVVTWVLAAMFAF